jgi:hypothetical protein
MLPCLPVTIYVFVLDFVTQGLGTTLMVLWCHCWQYKKHGKMLVNAAPSPKCLSQVMVHPTENDGGQVVRPSENKLTAHVVCVPCAP